MADVYDTVFRTVLNDCKEFLLPLLNEVFGESLDGTETVEFRPNELFLDQRDEPDRKRITDSNFTVSRMGCIQEVPSGVREQQVWQRDFDKDFRV